MNLVPSNAFQRTLEGDIGCLPSSSQCGITSFSTKTNALPGAPKTSRPASTSFVCHWLGGLTSLLLVLFPAICFVFQVVDQCTWQAMWYHGVDFCMWGHTTCQQEHVATRTGVTNLHGQP
eukprot:5746594-Amphidinium_carterae.3